MRCPWHVRPPGGIPWEHMFATDLHGATRRLRRIWAYAKAFALLEDPPQLAPDRGAAKLHARRHAAELAGRLPARRPGAVRAQPQPCTTPLRPAPTASNARRSNPDANARRAAHWAARQ